MKNSRRLSKTTVPGGAITEDAAGSGRWEKIGLTAILFLALGLRLWRLNHNRWGSEYYTAAVRSMTANWHNFFYVSFDPGGFLSMDKPPVALWLQVLSVKLFGFHPLSVLLPQVIMGVCSIWLLYHLVRRRFTADAALLAALFLGVTPVWVAVNRVNNTDTCLVLLLMLAAWALLKAAEKGSRRLLTVSMFLIGLAFNAKMLAAYIVLPAFCIVYFIGAPRRWPRKCVDLTLALLIMVLCSLTWVLAYEWTPKENRPFVGGSQGNSMLELIVGHNAKNRFFSPLRPPLTNSSDTDGKPAVAAESTPACDQGAKVKSSPQKTFTRILVDGPVGPLRLTGGKPAAQMLWLFPFALAALFIGPGQSRLQGRLAGGHLTILFWFCWLFTYAVVYSYLGGIVHFYYFSTMAPALAALAGIGVAGLLRLYRRNNARALFFPAMLIVAAAWQIHIQTSALGWTIPRFAFQPIHWVNRLHAAFLAGTILAVSGLLLIYFCKGSGRTTSVATRSLLAVGIAAMLVLPGAWAVSPLLRPGSALAPSADLFPLLSVTGKNKPRVSKSGDNKKLIPFLRANRENERYLLMTSTCELAAPIIIETGEAVLVRGGFHGVDPAVTPESLARMADKELVRFIMLGDVAEFSRRLNSDENGKRVDEWVRAHGKLVAPSWWRTSHMALRGMELYDLNPERKLTTPLIISLTGLVYFRVECLF